MIQTTKPPKHNTLSRRSYSTEFKLLYTLGLAPDNLINKIPKRTHYNILKYDFTKVYGFAYTHDKLDFAKRIIELQEQSRFNDAVISIGKTIIDIYSSANISLSNILKSSYSARFKVVEVIKHTKDVLGLDKACKLFHISRNTFFNWKNNNKCSDSIFNKCFKRHPYQLAKREVTQIKHILNDPKTILWPLISSYYYGLRNGLISMKSRTFYKYANKLGFKKKLPKHRHKKHVIGIRSSKPNELLHADLTIFKTLDNIKVYIYIIMDNFSRKILSYKATLKYSAQTSFECLKEAYENFILPDNSTSETKLMVDGGVEINNHKVDNYLQTEALSVQKIVAQQDVTFSNSMIEAVNKILKYNYLFKTEIKDFDECVRYLDKFIPDYNDRYHCSLSGLSPNEVYSGVSYDKESINKRIHDAKLVRLIENRQYNCQNHNSKEVKHLIYN